MSMGVAVFSEPDTVAQIQNIVNRFRDRWAQLILSFRFISEKVVIMGMLTRLYKKYGDDAMFRDTMEAFYRRVMEKKGLSATQLEDILGARFLSKDVREMVLEDIAEAQEALELKRYLEANEDRVYRFLTQSSVSES